jgi:hypothetical protein
MVTLQLYLPEGEVREHALESIEEVYPLIRHDLPVELRHGKFALTSGVQLVSRAVVELWGISTIYSGDFCFVYANGHLKIIDPQTIWRVSQVWIEKPQRDLIPPTGSNFVQITPQPRA